MKIRPLGEKILIKRLDAEEKTSSGIFLPESAKEKPQQAKVVSTGTGRPIEGGKRAEFQVKKGDTVLIGKWGGTEIKLDDEDYLVVSEEDILAVVA